MPDGRATAADITRQDGEVHFKGDVYKTRRQKDSFQRPNTGSDVSENVLPLSSERMNYVQVNVEVTGK